MKLSPEAQAKMEELADLNARKYLMPFDKHFDDVKSYFKDGFSAGYAFAREEERFKKECLKEEVLMHAGAYSTDIFPDYSLKENPNPSIDQVSGKMGRHMCKIFLEYIDKYLKESDS